MRAIPDIDNMRTCRKCCKTMPLAEFSQTPKRFVCKLCRSRMYSRKGPRLEKTWAQKMMTGVQWDSRAVYRVPHNIKLWQVKHLPCVVAEPTDDSRVVPIDFRTGIAPYNGVIVDKLTAKCLRACIVQNSMAMYTEILALKFPDARKPIEVVSLL